MMHLSVRPHICFYQSRDFVPASVRTIPRHCDFSRVHFADKFAAPMRVVMEYFEETTAERAGTLKGEYVAANIGVLIRRDGLLIKMNMTAEEPWASRKMDELCASAQLQANVRLLQKIWDRLPVIADQPLLSHPYHENYFHWTLETVPNLRFFESSGICVCEPCQHRLFQRDLLARVAEGRAIRPVLGSLVVRNPGLACTTMSEDGIEWLRRRAAFSTVPGRRRIYLRRSGSSRRWPAGGGICETPEFFDFLDQAGFETVDPGRTEREIQEQVRLVDGAAVILAPHGAALTNLAYLSPPLSVIEVMGSRTARAMFMHLSSICGFDHHVVFGSSYDEAGDIVVDIADLRVALERCAPPPCL